VGPTSVNNMKNKILIVDDDEELRDELRYCFEEFMFVEAGDGREALKVLKRAHNIDLILLDIKMPGMDGIELLEKIRENDLNIGIIILTGHGTKEVVVSAIKKRANDYFEKPININELKESIEKLLRNKNRKNNIEAMDIVDKIKMSEEFIKENYFKQINLKDVASMICLSRKYFSRMFRKITGKRFVQYKSEIKMKKAKEYLKNTSLNISQIAFKLGYDNAESFCRDFVMSAGRSPRDYRKKMSNMGLKK